jgi:dipeptidyl-peptidase-4
MTRTLFTLLAVIVLVFEISAQDKVFTASDYIKELTPKSINGLSWRPGQDAFTWIENESLIQKTILNPAKADTLLKLEALNKNMKELKESELRRFPQISWTGSSSLYFVDQNRIFLYDLSSSRLKKVNEFDSSGENVTISDKSFNAAYTIKNNLFAAVNGVTIQVNGGDEKEIVYGQIPSRNEFGINAGIYWSPDGKKIAFYRVDQSEVPSYRC